jgi:hypothetical protein
MNRRCFNYIKKERYVGYIWDDRMSCECSNIAIKTRDITTSNCRRSNEKQGVYLHHVEVTLFLVTRYFGYIWAHRMSCGCLKIAKNTRDITSSNGMRSNAKQGFYLHHCCSCIRNRPKKRAISRPHMTCDPPRKGGFCLQQYVVT